jgi:FKBP-type peptidyl-prolyl cis-trans isomerase FkpA
MKAFLSYCSLLLLFLTGCSKADYTDGALDGTLDTIAQQDGQIQSYITSHNLSMQKDFTGMYYQIQVAGDTGRMTLESVPTINYTRKNLQDSLLDASLGSTNFDGRKLKDHIVGWQIGLQQIGKGGKILMIIPSPLGFGKSAVGNIIPANTILVCEVELENYK